MENACIVVSIKSGQDQRFDNYQVKKYLDIVLEEIYRYVENYLR